MASKALHAGSSSVGSGNQGWRCGGTCSYAPGLAGRVMTCKIGIWKCPACFQRAILGNLSSFLESYCLGCGSCTIQIWCCSSCECHFSTNLCACAALCRCASHSEPGGMAQTMLAPALTLPMMQTVRAVLCCVVCGGASLLCDLQGACHPCLLRWCSIPAACSPSLHSGALDDARGKH